MNEPLILDYLFLRLLTSLFGERTGTVMAAYLWCDVHMAGNCRARTLMTSGHHLWPVAIAPGTGQVQ